MSFSFKKIRCCLCYSVSTCSRPQILPRLPVLLYPVKAGSIVLTLTFPERIFQVASTTKITQFLAESANSANGLYWLLKGSQCLSVNEVPSRKANLSEKCCLGSIASKPYHGRGGRLIPCVTIRPHSAMEYNACTCMVIWSEGIGSILWLSWPVEKKSSG